MKFWCTGGRLLVSDVLCWGREKDEESKKVGCCLCNGGDWRGEPYDRAGGAEGKVPPL